MSSEMRELVRKWKFNLRLLGPDVARRVLESCISDVEALLARTEAGAKCDHAWQPDSDVMNARYCPKCDVTQTIPKKTTHPQDASGDAEDARRYRWARDHVGGTAWNDDNFATVTIGVTVPKPRGTCAFDVTAEMLDAAIDSAMQAKEAR